jgi:hypothetical protein
MRSRTSVPSWLELRGEGDPEEPLFLPVRKHRKARHTDAHGEKKSSLSDQAAYKMVKRRHREARIKGVSSYLSGEFEWLPSTDPNLPSPVTGIWLASIPGTHGVRWETTG